MTVTISRAYGAAAGEIARKAADLVGYRVLDEQLPIVVDIPRSFPERVLRSFAAAVPELTAPANSADTQDDLDDVRATIETMVRAAADEGDVMIVGRMGAAILAERPDVLRVFVNAPLAWRVAHIADVFGMDARRAEAEVARVDEARRTYARERYRVTWGDPRSYDLMLDTGRFGVDGAAAVLAAAVRAAAG